MVVGQSPKLLIGVQLAVTPSLILEEEKMISLHIPKGKQFDMSKELSSASNIRDRTVRNVTVQGL